MRRLGLEDLRRLFRGDIMQKEPYRYSDNASDEMLIDLLLTLDGRGIEEKRKALIELLCRASDRSDLVMKVLK